MRTVTILGATGSVGTSTLDLVEREPDQQGERLHGQQAIRVLVPREVQAIRVHAASLRVGAAHDRADRGTGQEDGGGT